MSTGGNYKVRMRLAAADVAALAANLREELVGLRVSNVYDCLPTPMSPNSYAVKLSGTPKSSSARAAATAAAEKADDAEEAGTTKALLVIDAPMRVHTTAIARPRKEVVSVLALQLRKHLRGKRLENVEQLGIDRVLRLSFGTGDLAMHVIVELYAQGNVLLTDSSDVLISVMRKHDYGADVGVVAAKRQYPMAVISRLPAEDTYSVPALTALVRSMVDENSEKLRLRAEQEAKEKEMEDEAAPNADEEQQQQQQIEDEASEGKGKNKGKNKGPKKQQKPAPKPKAGKKGGERREDAGVFVRDVVRKFLDGGAHWMRAIVERSGIEWSRDLANPAAPLTEDDFRSLSDALAFGFAWFRKPAFHPAYILLTPPPPPTPAVAETSAPAAAEPAPEQPAAAEALKQRYYDFVSGEVMQQCCGVTEKDRFEQFGTLDLALDAFFTQMEMRALERERLSVERNLEKKHEKFVQEQESRLNALRRTAERFERGAQLIEYNIQLVEQLIVEMRTLVSSGMQWPEIERMVKALKKKDPMSIANFIHTLQLQKNVVVILLCEPADDDAAEVDAEEVPVDFTLSAQANVTRLYGERTAVLSKLHKMEAVSEEVQKRAEKKHARDMAKTIARKQVAGTSANLSLFSSQVRKKFWFEKFDWFISSENFVVVSGRDMQQNEMLYRRYMRENDIYIHADVHGAATCLIKNPDARPIGASTLEQAGRHSMCHSSAWSAKLVTSAWWVRPAQVTKSAPSGEYLPTGSFMIRGKKNFLPPHELVLGYGILFVLDPVSVPNHAGERMPADETLSSAIPLLSDSAREKEELQNASFLPALSGGTDGWDSMRSSRLEGESDEEGEDGHDHAAEEDESNAGSAEAVPTPDDIIASVFGLQKPAASETEPKRKAKMSVHERKMLKMKERGKDVPEPGSSSSSSKPPKAEAPKKEAKNAPPAPKPRMTKAKARKLRKYADEDEEDREIRLMLNGFKKPQPAAAAPAATSASASSDAKEESAAKKNVCFICGSSSHYARDCPKRKEADQAPAAPAAAAPAAAAPVDVVDDDSSEGEDDDKETLGGDVAAAAGKSSAGSELSRLTGSPKSDDVLLYAIPVCAPYDALKNYKYKVKLTPGHLKRSKAVQSSLAVFMKQSDATAQERRLIQAISESDLTQTMPSDVTVAGGQASARYSKKGGKK